MTQRLDQLTAEWNDSGTTFDALRMAVTDLDSDAASRLLRLLVDDVEMLALRKDGLLSIPIMPEVDGNPIVARGSNSDGRWTKLADGTAFFRHLIGPLPTDDSLSATFDPPIPLTNARVTWTLHRNSGTAATGKRTWNRTSLSDSALGKYRIQSGDGDFETDTFALVIGLGDWF